MARLLTQRFSKDLLGSVKYSTLCPSRRDSPSAASRAMPINCGLSEEGSKGREDMYSPFIRLMLLRKPKPVKAGIPVEPGQLGCVRESIFLRAARTAAAGKAHRRQWRNRW